MTKTRHLSSELSQYIGTIELNALLYTKDLVEQYNCFRKALRTIPEALSKNERKLAKSILEERAMQTKQWMEFESKEDEGAE